MVAVWEGQDEALFERSRKGVDNDKKDFYPRATQNLSSGEPECSRAMQQLCILRTYSRRGSQWVWWPLLWCILERKLKMIESSTSVLVRQRHSRIQPVKPGLFRGCSHSWYCSLWKHLFHQPQSRRTNKDNENYTSFRFKI